MEEFENHDKEKILEQRKNKFLEIGKQKSFTEFLKIDGSLGKKYNYFKYKLIIILLISLGIAFLFIR